MTSSGMGSFGFTPRARENFEKALFARWQAQYIRTAGIKNVYFNDPVTVVIWSDGTKTIVRAKNEAYDPEKGLAMAICKKVMGNKGNYYETFKEWLPEKPENI